MNPLTETFAEKEARWAREREETQKTLRGLRESEEKLAALRTTSIRDLATPSQDPTLRDNREPAIIAVEHSLPPEMHYVVRRVTHTAKFAHIQPMGADDPVPVYNLDSGASVGIDVVRKLKAGDAKTVEIYHKERRTK
ncbi:hypothetical protein HN592_02780 [Candidatus Woesearchaeota archaeon]|jgi:hypothetical protein|nr:hypothetical protein [Candidatus Woesearchaeota archaeon]MBT4368137.1 hypothetical protein [Candidatus Woesearchaeota archaeon]MBT4712625.1 hypothetical protein [Candidatus Woesearchaeota archaeon]MBT6639538.1 hypothetical protein [Candidatus Woesearchaeota archaeon]MBT7133710.1 hypothetical protein [Candidatus Woesearchaeota archaeon]